MKNLLLLLLSVLSVSALPYVLQTNDVRVFSASIVSVIICISFFYTMKKAYLVSKDFNVKKIYFLGWIFSLLLVTGRNFALFGFVYYSWLNCLKTIVTATCFSFITTACLLLLINIIEKLKKNDVLKDCSVSKFLQTKPFRKSFLIILFFWFIYWITVAPGFFEYDMVFQLKELYSNQLTNWHSVLHTLYGYYTLKLGQTYFHNDNIGMIFYVLPQVLFMISVFAYSVRVFVKYKAPFTAVLFALAFYSLYPIIPLLSFATDKDVFFSGFLFLIAILTAEAVLNSEKFFRSKRKLFLLFLSAIFSILFRSNGILIVSGITLIYLIFFKNFRKQIILSLCIPVILGFLWFFKISPMINIGNVPPEEPISIPMHQIASVLKIQKADVTDREMFYKVIRTNALETYSFQNMDYLKFDLSKDWTDARIFNRQAYLDNKQYYSDLWFKLAKQYPFIYTGAFLNLNYPFWYPDYIYMPENHTGINYMIIGNYNLDNIGFNVKSFFPANIKFWNKIFNNVQNRIPLYQKNFISGNMFSTGLPFWIMVFTMFYLAYKRKNRYMLILTTPFMSFLCYLFSPTYLVRYNFPVILCIPLFVFCILYFSDDE